MAIMEFPTPTACMLSVDFPRQNEAVTSERYSIRITAPADCKEVDISIDQGAWRPCRKDGGHWWYDWAGYETGEHEIIARLETPEGRRVACEPHEFFVRL